IGMKKSRPGTMLTCLCTPEMRENMVTTFFKYTTTIGLREHRCSRCTLERVPKTVPTKYGDVSVKTVSGWGVTRQKPEFEDVARIARQQNLSLEDVAALLQE
ncbi:MAG: nickel insertion protein, partial [Oscillospiraceae bacterium]